MTLRAHLVDTRPLRTSRPFRELWCTSLLVGLAGQVAAVAALVQVWDLTASAVWTGAIGLSQGMAVLVLGVVGGSLADRLDRRSLVLISSVAQTSTALGLTAQAVVDDGSPTVVLALIAAHAGAGALGSPARRTLPVRLLPREQVTAGLALQNMGSQASMLVGPALGGVVAAMSLPAAFGVQALLLPLAVVAAWRLPALPPERVAGAGVQPGGWSFPVRRPVLRGALLTDLATTTLSMPIAIFPMVNAVRFDGDPRTLGLFLSAIAVGGTVSGLLSGRVSRFPRAGMVQIVCSIVWGFALVGFGLSSSVVVALAFLVLAGGADTVGVVARGGLVQLATPDGLRGRVLAVDHVIGVAGPEIGNMRGGVLAAAMGAPAALVVGGLSAVLAATLVGATHPQLRRWTNDVTTDAEPPAPRPVPRA